MEKIVVAVDAMGGDNAPRAICEGALEAAREYDDVKVVLFGREGDIRVCLPESCERLEVVNASEVIEMSESPVMAIRKKTDSSMVRALLAVRAGEADALVTAGSTGALLAGGMTRVGRLKGIERPALAPVLPGRKKPFMLIDSGANVDCLPQFLQQFGLMGSAYMERVLGVKSPKVALLNIGAEDEKGSQLYKQANALMRAQTAYNFVGNIEARDVPQGEADVVVADGFDGNVVLKYTEGLVSAVMGMLKEAMLADTRSKLGALLVKPALKKFKTRFDYNAYGGAPLLGVNGALVKAHGSSDAGAIKNAIRQARDMARGGVKDVISAAAASLAVEEKDVREDANNGI